MPWVETVTIVGLVVLAVLIVVFMKTRSKDLLAEIIEKKKATSKVVSRAEYVEGMQRMPVAVSLTDSAFYYENPDLQASFDLAMIDEIEYDDELATGRSVEHGCRVLRLRSHGTTFDFILAPADCEKWMAALPQRRLGAVQQKAG
jgi:hypothetical protein